LEHIIIFIDKYFIIRKYILTNLKYDEIKIKEYNNNNNNNNNK